MAGKRWYGQHNTKGSVLQTTRHMSQTSKFANFYEMDLPNNHNLVHKVLHTMPKSQVIYFWEEFPRPL